MTRFALVPITIFALQACSPDPGSGNTSESGSRGSETTDTAAAAAGIDSLEARFLAAYNRDDAKALAETYAEDVRFIQEGRVEEGRGRIEQAWKEEVANLSDVKLATVDRVIRGDVAVLTQRFSQKYRAPDGKTVADSGYFVATVRRDPDGQWRYHTVMLSRPPQK